jgi:hypothetical protein
MSTQISLASLGSDVSNYIEKNLEGFAICKEGKCAMWNDVAMRCGLVAHYINTPIPVSEPKKSYEVEYPD